MSNPFGDFDEDPRSLSTPVKSRPDRQTASQNPFGDFDDEVPNTPFSAESRPQASAIRALKKSSPTPHSTSSPCSSLSASSRLSTSRLSLSSNSETASIGSGLNGSLLTNTPTYSLGDGSLQKEGLLCPNCLLEFKTITELMRHSEKCFANASNSGETGSSSLFGTSPGGFASADQMGLQIKDFFLNRLRNKGASRQGGPSPRAADLSDELNPFDSEQNQQLNQTLEQVDPVSEWKNYMVMGPRRNHMTALRAIRESRIERYVYETNKLLIRLDKLLRDYPPPTDPLRRREHEQAIVSWIDETIVSLCPFCASKFNILTRKKHHCRLCGAVMCTKCSEFISFDYARRLINPAGLDPPSGTAGITRGRSSRSSSLSSLGGNSPAGIGRALLSVVSASDPNEDAERIRLCLDCKGLLEVRREKLELAHGKPVLVELYGDLKEQIDEIEKLTPILLKMAASLNCGETTYSLADANDLKRKLTRLGEKTDLMSRKIESLGVTKPTPDTPSPPQPPQRHLNLQLSIRRSTIAFIRKALLGLPELPTEESFRELRAANEASIQRRIAYEKELVLREQANFMPSDLRRPSPAKNHQNLTNSSSSTAKASFSPSSGQAIISLEDGFCPQTSSTDLWSQMSSEERATVLDTSGDPIEQQISIIRTYIRTAREKHRYEEVAMLEENLKELEIELYFKAQQDRGDGAQGMAPNQQAPEKSTGNPFGDFEDDS